MALYIVCDNNISNIAYSRGLRVINCQNTCEQKIISYLSRYYKTISWHFNKVDAKYIINEFPNRWRNFQKSSVKICIATIASCFVYHPSIFIALILMVISTSERKYNIKVLMSFNGNLAKKSFDQSNVVFQLILFRLSLGLGLTR